MVNITDPVTQWAFIVLVSVVMGTGVLIAVAFFRRWQQIRYVRYVHTLRRAYRPILAELLSGAASPSGIEALRKLPMADLELLLDPLFSKRKITERSLVFLRALCAELGLIELWQSRLANGHAADFRSSGNGAHENNPDRAVMRYLLRAKSIRNLGTLRHRPSWPLLIKALDDHHPDIQLVALRSLAALGAPESFPVLRERLHAVVQGKTPSPPLPGLQAAMVSFDLTCAPALLPSLRHADRQVRLCATEILRTMVCREAARRAGLALTPELLTPEMVELLLSELAVDTHSEIRARAAEVVAFLADPRVPDVLRALLHDHQWFVRLRTARALTHCPAAGSLHVDIRQCLRDPHWRVREAAIQTLISLGPEGRHQLYEHFLATPDRTTRQQILEVIERRGLLSALVEEYSAGAKGVEARMVEQFANDVAAQGLSGVLCALHPDVLQKFLDRMLPHVEAKLQSLGEVQPEVERAFSLQKARVLPPHLAA
jgi:HEAT repeat protein